MLINGSTSEASIILIESDSEEQHDNDVEVSFCPSASSSSLAESDVIFETDYSETSLPQKRKRHKREKDYKMKIADRRKAYEAARSEDGRQWRGLPVLVSVTGYQLETEL